MFWIKKGIPQCEVHPIFGSLTFLQKINPGTWMASVYNQYSHPYVGIWVFWRPGLIVNCPNLAHNILVRDSDNFRNRLLSTGTRDKLGTHNIFTANDPLWSAIRKRLTSVFTTAKVKNWQDLYRSKSADLVFRIKSDNEKDVKINLKEIFADYTTDIIGESAFGIKCEATKTGSGALRAMTKEFEKYSTYRGIQCFTFWPKHTNAYAVKLFRMIVKQRGGYEKETEGKKDLLDVLLKMKQNAIKDNQNVDEMVLISNAMIFLQGGYETSSTLLCYMIYEMAYKPPYQQRVYEELKEVKNKIGDKELGASDLSELPFFNAIIKEALRKYPIMGWLDRTSSREYQVDEHLTIPAGTVVYVNSNGMHQDPNIFPDPMEFKPERFLPENMQTFIPYAYLPFGDGPRSCIGKLFGMFSMRFGFAAIISNFILEPFPNAPAPNDVTVERRGLFYGPGEVLSVKFVPRTEPLF
ncbi:unnamed protein product [Arctia plantaginis]|uniref:unspecific monooxygenase n=1 Tax=Arctia plantaginis TaxID=874455 RepID=A0A8S1AWC6_ARCPL|nr:unnamed protein product [Arctia plantaginis]